MHRNRISIVPGPTSQTTKVQAISDSSAEWDSKWLHARLAAKAPVTHAPDSEMEADSDDQPEIPVTLRFLRWLFPEVNQRRAKRYTTPGLVAYYWTGGAPYSFHVGDMSATGIFLLTKERWAPGTLIQMTLQKQDGRVNNSDSSICVLSEVVRWGENGSGFNFILSDYENVANYGIMPQETINRKSIERFMQKIGVPETR
jgi:hypothetical protein